MLAGITPIRSWLTARQRKERSPQHCRKGSLGNRDRQQKLLGRHGVRGGGAGSSTLLRAAAAAAAAPRPPRAVLLGQSFGVRGKWSLGAN